MLYIGIGGPTLKHAPCMYRSADDRVQGSRHPAYTESFERRGILLLYASKLRLLASAAREAMSCAAAACRSSLALRAAATPCYRDRRVRVGRAARAFRGDSRVPTPLAPAWQFKTSVNRFAGQ